MNTLVFSSVLRPHHRSELERLFFLNPRQDQARRQILAAVERHGLPRLRTQRGSLRITLDGCPEAQNLFAIEQQSLHSRVVGCIIYLREHAERLTIAHLAVDPDYVLSAQEHRLPLAAELIAQVMDIARRIKGVQQVVLPYSGGRTLKL